MVENIKQSLLLLFIGIVSYIIVFLINAVLSRYMTSDVYGDYTVALSLMDIVASIILLGTNSSANRFIPRLYQDRNFEQLLGYLVWNANLLKKSFLVCFSVAALLAGIALFMHFYGYMKFEEYHLAFHALWIAPLAALVLLCSNYFISIRHTILGSIFQSFAINGLMLVCFLAAIFFFELTLGGDGTVITTWVVSFGILLFIQVAILKWKDFTFLSTLKNVFSKNNTYKDEIWKKSTTSFMVISIVNSLIWYLDLFIVELAGRQEGSTGYYSAILVITRVIYIIPFYIGLSIASSVSYYFNKPNQYPRLQQVVNSANFVNFIVSVLMLLVIIGYHEEILNFFGAAYKSVGKALIILAFGTCIVSIARVPRIILLYSGHENFMLHSAIITLLLILIAGIPATYYWGVNGIAWVSTVILSLQSLFFIIFNRVFMRRFKSLTLF